MKDIYNYIYKNIYKNKKETFKCYRNDIVISLTDKNLTIITYHLYLKKKKKISS